MVHVLAEQRVGMDVSCETHTDHRPSLIAYKNILNTVLSAQYFITLSQFFMRIAEWPHFVWGLRESSCKNLVKCSGLLYSVYLWLVLTELFTQHYPSEIPNKSTWISLPTVWRITYCMFLCLWGSFCLTKICEGYFLMRCITYHLETSLHFGFQ